MKSTLLILSTLLFLSGCAHVMSEEARSLVDPAITFSRLRSEPESLVGKYVMLGGIIAGVRNEKDGSQLEVVQSPMGSDELPEEASHASGGRFLAVTSGFLDPLVYKTGRRITLVGQVRGKQNQPLEKIDYTYPVISIREIHVWKKSEIDPTYYPPPGYFYDPFRWGWGPPSWYFRSPYYWY
jgi:outer membrane lipoprotein